MKQGTVWLVGAGPCAEGLLTLRGAQVLKRAEVVVYDRLVGPGICSHIPDSAETVYVGKRMGNHSMPQEEINRLLLQKAQEGKRVVRLKGGDPFLFGRGGEELVLLREHGIPFEVVPGIPSALSVPAYAGIPVTHRGTSASVHIMTGHGKDGPTEFPYRALTELAGTLVFLMSLSNLDGICCGLLEAGMPPETPAAVLERGTSPGQKQYRATLGSICQKMESEDTETPVMILVGASCELADNFSWYEQRPLAGRQILLTRPERSMDSLKEELEFLGADVHHAPMIQLTEPEGCILHFESLAACDWLAWTSPRGVHRFMELVERTGSDIRALYGVKLAAVGDSTAKALRHYGLCPDLVPAEQNAKGLGEALAAACTNGAKICLLRSSAGTRSLNEILEANPAVTVDELPLYGTRPRTEPSAVLRQNGTRPYWCVVFTSGAAADGYAAQVPPEQLASTRAVCIGLPTEQAAKRHGMQTVTAAEPSDKGLLDAILRINEQEAAV